MSKRETEGKNCPIGKWRKLKERTAQLEKKRKD